MQTTADFTARYGDRYRWRVLITVMVAMMAAIVSSTIVNVAVPDISKAFAVGQDRAQWVATGFMVPMTLALSLTPSLLQRFGLRGTYTGGVVLLMVGGLIGGFSPTFEVMIGARVLQGLAAGALQPIPSIIILRAFGTHEQGRAMGLFGFGVVLAPALGPTVGGLLIEAFSWRAIFFFVVPFCLIALGMAHRYLPWQSQFAMPDRRFDWIGLALLSAATLLLLNGVVGLHAGGAGLGLAMLAGAVPFTAIFVWWQLRRTNPLLEIGLVRYRQFTMGSIVSFGYGLGLFGSTYLLPIFLQLALGYTPSAAGLVLLPAGLVLAATIPIAGRLADRMPAAWLVTVGVLVLGLSLALMGGVVAATAYMTIILLVVLGRIGLGLIMPSLTIGSVRGLPTGHMPQAASMSSFFRQLGGAVGVGMVGTLLEWRLQAHSSDPVSAFSETFLVLAAICASTAFASWWMRPAEPQQAPSRKPSQPR